MLIELFLLFSHELLILFVYLNTFKELYTEASITPKMHFLTHFPKQLEDFGPLRSHHCFRFEAKNGLLLE